MKTILCTPEKTPEKFWRQYKIDKCVLEHFLGFQQKMCVLLANIVI